MAGQSDERVYEVEFEYQEAGYSLAFKVSEWMEMVEKDFTSFNAIKEVFGTDREDLEKSLREHMVEVDGESDEEAGRDFDGPSIVFKNPPSSWTEDPAEAADVYDALNLLLARMGLYSLMETELEAENELISGGQYKSVLIRQSAFFEALLTFRAQLTLQEQKSGVLSRNEIGVVEDMGHRDRIRLAHLFGQIDEEEHGLLQRMANWRNQIAHTSWHDFDAQDESQMESTAKQVRDLLQQRIADAEGRFEEVDDQEQVDDFTLGFDALSTEQQLLQISIFTALDGLDGSASLSKIQEIVDMDSTLVKNRIGNMRAVGYIENDDGVISLTDQGRQFVVNEIQ